MEIKATQMHKKVQKKGCTCTTVKHSLIFKSQFANVVQQALHFFCKCGVYHDVKQVLYNNRGLGFLNEIRGNIELNNNTKTSQTC